MKWKKTRFNVKDAIELLAMLGLPISAYWKQEIVFCVCWVGLVVLWLATVVHGFWAARKESNK